MKEKIVFFDLDSTVAKIEGLDFLAQGKEPEVQREIERLTELAMNGYLSFEEAMKLKMELLKPSQNDMAILAEQYKQSLTDDAPEVMQEIKKAGIQVGIITGNFEPAVYPLAEMLGIDRENVHANRIDFDENGQYKRYYPEDPSMASDGKAQKIKELRPRYRRITMVGDGSTDLNTKPFVDRFIGFGGIKERPIVKEQADIFIASPTLAPVLLNVLPRWKRELRRLQGDSLMQKARKANVIRRR